MRPRLTTAIGGTLVLFHGWLLGGQAWQGQLADPALTVRWLLAGALLVAFAALRQRGASIWGRKAIALWLLAALLHGPAVTDLSMRLGSPALPEAVTTLAQIAAVSVILGVGLALLIALVIRRSAPLLLSTAVGRFHSRGSRPAWALPFAPRPPPGGASLSSI
jgi:hypothetical protein